MKKIRYKVVKKRNRTSAMLHGNSKYALKYLDGWKVYADAKTVGVIVFETAASAKEWVWVWNTCGFYHDDKDLIILKVLPLGRGKRIIWLAPDIDTETIDRFYKGDDDLRLGEAPDHTIAYPGVEVLGEYKWK